MGNIVALSEKQRSVLDDIDCVLRERTRDTANEIRNVSWSDSDVFASWLGQCFYIVRHTTRFLCKLTSSFGFDRQSFHQFGLKHLREETGHELLAEKDLTSIGYGLSDISEVSSTKSMIEEQYRLLNECPVAHFGFFLYLENLSIQCGPDLLNTLEELYGSGPLSFLRLHVQEDVRHVEIITQQLGQASVAEIEASMRNINTTAEQYVQMLRELKTGVSVGTDRAAA